MTPHRTAAVILTWNGCAHTLACLESLQQQVPSPALYVVDNGSTDATVPTITARFPAARLIVNAENLGFAGGMSVGLRAAFADGAETALVLNNDTVLIPDAVAHLLAAADMYPEAGLFSPLILFRTPPHHIWFDGATLNRWTGRSVHRHYRRPKERAPHSVQPLGRATACALLITRSCFECIGGFDAALFIYFVDVEYSLRARDAGFAILLVPQAVVYHHVAAAMGVKSPDTIYYFVRNGITVMDWHRPLPTPLAAIRRGLMLLALTVYLMKPPHALARWRDAIAGYRDARHRHLGPRHVGTLLH